MTIDGSGDRWDGQVGHFYYPNASFEGLSNWVRGILDWKFPSELVEPFWAGFLPQLQKLHRDYTNQCRRERRRERRQSMVGRSQT